MFEKERMRRALGLGVVAVSLGVAVSALAGGHQWGRSDGGDAELRGNAPLVLTTGERTELVRMREEEKMARDVYRTLGDQWGLTPFLHIQNSEEHHLAIVGDLLVRSGTKDPIQNDATGVFQSNEMRNLYTDLTRMGRTSPEAALRAGAKIEELDIADLTRAIQQARNPEIRGVYEGLRRASGNHLRAFNRNLDARGVSYVPQHLSQAEFRAIVDGQHESCGLCGGAGGAGCGNCSGAGNGWGAQMGNGKHGHRGMGKGANQAANQAGGCGGACGGGGMGCGGGRSSAR
ncbi:MAG: DUF2202 domain-containing protein [Candidatus Eisenbacteria bacterium]|nr:DUF2202 domain-containing protein [Candidatus Eisenbacteria bacterium]